MEAGLVTKKHACTQLVLKVSTGIWDEVQKIWVRMALDRFLIGARWA